MKRQTTAEWLVALMGEDYWRGQFGLQNAMSWQLRDKLARILRLAKLRRRAK